MNTTDTSTQAMTEVALGLSMAFFSILIIALLSMQVTVPDNGTPSDQNTSKNTVELSANTQADSAGQASVVFFYEQRWFDTNLREIAFDEVNSTNNLVLAIPPETSFTQALDLQNKLSVEQLRMTQIDQKWLQALAQR